MRVQRIVPTILLALLPVGGLCHRQSLGEAARQTRLQKQKNGTPAKRVITSDDLSTDPRPARDSTPASPKKDTPSATELYGATRKPVYLGSHCSVQRQSSSFPVTA